MVIGVHLIVDVLKRNHAVFEHPITCVRLAMTAVVEVDELPTLWIDLGGLGSEFDLR